MGEIPSRDRLAELAQVLFDLRRDEPEFAARVQQRNPATLPAVYGISRFALDTGHAGVEMWQQDRQTVAVPLFRSAFESAVTAAWLTQNREAIRGFVSEEQRQRRVLSSSMSRAISASFREGADSLAHLHDDPIETMAAPSARSFEQRCRELVGGADMYVYYRMLSAHSHPGAFVADYYAEADETVPGGCRLRLDARPLEHESWLFLAVAAMLWGQRALDHLDGEHRHRSTLRRVARELGVMETLRLTPEAAQAAALAEQARRRAKRLRQEGR